MEQLKQIFGAFFNQVTAVLLLVFLTAVGTSILLENYTSVSTDLRVIIVCGIVALGVGAIWGLEKKGKIKVD